MKRGVPYVSRRLRVPGRMLVLGALALAGLGGIAAVFLLRGPGPSSSFDGFVYVESNSVQRDANTVLAYRFRNGRLALLGEFPTGGRGAIDLGQTGALDAEGQIAYDRRRRLLFAVNQGSDSVAVFQVRRDGRLMPAPGSPFPSRGRAPASVAVVGELVVVVNKAHDARRGLERVPPNYAVFRIVENGTLTPVGRPFAVGASTSPTQALAVPPRLVVGTEESGPFRALLLGTEGSLVQGPNSPLAPESSIFPRRYEGARWAIGLVPHPFQRLLYANQPGTSQLLVYAYDGGGRLTFVRAVDNRGSKLPCWTVVTPDGRRLYTANAGNGTVSAFDLEDDPTSPRRLQTLALKSASNPWGLALDPSGHTLFVVDPRAVALVRPGRGNRLHALAVRSSGRLDELGSSPVRLPVGRDASPLGIAVVPR